MSVMTTSTVPEATGSAAEDGASAQRILALVMGFTVVGALAFLITPGGSLESHMPGALMMLSLAGIESSLYLRQHTTKWRWTRLVAIASVVAVIPALVKGPAILRAAGLALGALAVTAAVWRAPVDEAAELSAESRSDDTA